MKGIVLVLYKHHSADLFCTSRSAQRCRCSDARPVSRVPVPGFVHLVRVASLVWYPAPRIKDRECMRDLFRFSPELRLRDRLVPLATAAQVAASGVSPVR